MLLSEYSSAQLLMKPMDIRRAFTYNLPFA